MAKTKKQNVWRSVRVSNAAWEMVCEEKADTHTTLLYLVEQLLVEAVTARRATRLEVLV